MAHRFYNSERYESGYYSNPDIKVEFDSASTSDIGVHTWSHTIGNYSNRILIVGISIQNVAYFGSVTFGGITLTKLGESQGTFRGVSIWYMLDPPVGTANVTVIESGIVPDVNMVYCALSLYNVNQTLPFRNTETAGGSGVTYTKDITTVVNDLVVAVGCGWHYTSDYEMVPDVSQTELWNYVDNGPQGVGTTFRAVSTTTTINGTINTTGEEWRLYLLAIQKPYDDVDYTKQYSRVGDISGIPINTVAKFNTIDVNNAETLNDAKITLVHQAAISTTVCNTNVYLNDIDTAVLPETGTDAEALDITAGVEWSGIDAGVVNAELVGPAIKADVQTVVDRVGWANGNDMLVLVKDNTSDTDAYRQIYGGAYVGTEGMNKNPKLGVYFDYRHWKVLGVTNPATVFGYTAAQINKINGLL